MYRLTSEGYNGRKGCTYEGRYPGRPVHSQIASALVSSSGLQAYRGVKSNSDQTHNFKCLYTKAISSNTHQLHALLCHGTHYNIIIIFDTVVRQKQIIKT